MLNKVMLQGRLTEHPELKYTKSNKAVVDFSIAVEDSRAVNGERNVNFFKCEAWGNTAKFICKYFEKGQQIIVDGRLATNNYTDKNGIKRTDVFLSVEGVNFCGAKSSEAQQKDIEKSFDTEVGTIE